MEPSLAKIDLKRLKTDMKKYNSAGIFSEDSVIYWRNFLGIAHVCANCHAMCMDTCMFSYSQSCRILLMNLLHSHSHTNTDGFESTYGQIPNDPVPWILNDLPTVASAQAEQVNIPEKISKIHQFQTQPQQSKV